MYNHDVIKDKVVDINELYSESRFKYDFGSF